MIILSGTTIAAQIEPFLKKRVLELREKNSRVPSIAAVLFVEDAGSRLYTKLKKEAAERVGISYQVHEVSLVDPLADIQKKISELAADPQVTGVMIQKPWRKTWETVLERHATNQIGEKSPAERKAEYTKWWHALAEEVPLSKDVDGLHPSGKSEVMPATARAVGVALVLAVQLLPSVTAESVHWPDTETSIDAGAVLSSRSPLYTELWRWIAEKKVVIIGKSDIVGKPLFSWLSGQSPWSSIELIGKKELDAKIAAGSDLKDADIVISCTGVRHLITGSMLKNGAVVIDVGEPRADVDFATLKAVSSHGQFLGQPAFVTPVPGGIGPLTVQCLLANAVELI